MAFSKTGNGELFIENKGFSIVEGWKLGLLENGRLKADEDQEARIHRRPEGRLSG